MNEITIVNNEETKVKKLSNKQRELNFARQNGLQQALESCTTRQLKTMTEKVYRDLAAGNIALWDLARDLHEIKVTESYIEDPDNQIAFTTYLTNIGLDKSNMLKYIRAYETYYMLEDAGFTMGAAVALLNSGVDGDDFIGNFRPEDMTVRQIKEWVKQRNALTDTEEEQTEEQEQTKEQEQTEEQEQGQERTEPVKYTLTSDEVYKLSEMLGVEPIVVFEALNDLFIEPAYANK